jgi:HK97 family phage major capsid protein
MSSKQAAARLKEIHSRAPGKLIERPAEVVGIDDENRTAELAFSSEAPVERWWGEETLSHDPAHVRMGRLADGAAYLWNHNWDDQRGVVESARIDPDRKGRAVVRFGTSASAEELWQDVKGKIKRHVSVGYFIHDMQLTGVTDDMERWLITDWEPYEISSVSVPADVTVGIGRKAEIAQVDQKQVAGQTLNLSNIQTKTVENRTKKMFEKILRNAAGDLVRAKVDEDGSIVEVLEVLEKAGDGQRQASQQGQAAERARVSAINALAERFKKGVPNGAELARTAVADGSTEDKFRELLLDAVDKRMAAPLPEQARSADIGMDPKDLSNYSLLNVARALAEPGNKALRNAAAMEFRASEAAAEKYGKDGQRFVVPTDVLRRAVGGDYSRAMMNTSTTTNGNGGILVDTTLQTGSFIHLLRNKAVFMKNARVLGGLVGNIDIPKQTAGATASWVGEDEDAKETGIALGMVSMKPKTISAFSDVGRRLLKQSSMDAEAMLRDDLAIAVALGIDYAGFYGTGSEYQPRGLVNYDGINAVALAGDYPTWDEIVEFETLISLDNADVDSMRWVGNASLRGAAKTALKFQSAGSATLWEPGNTINGYGVDITNQVKTGDTFFGNWQDAVVGMWGGLELTVDTAVHALNGGLRLIVFQDIDIVLRRVESFALGRKA